MFKLHKMIISWSVAKDHQHLHSPSPMQRQGHVWRHEAHLHHVEVQIDLCSAGLLRLLGPALADPAASSVRGPGVLERMWWWKCWIIKWWNIGKCSEILESGGGWCCCLNRFGENLGDLALNWANQENQRQLAPKHGWSKIYLCTSILVFRGQYMYRSWRWMSWFQ